MNYMKKSALESTARRLIPGPGMEDHPWPWPLEGNRKGERGTLVKDIMTSGSKGLGDNFDME